MDDRYSVSLIYSLFEMLNIIFICLVIILKQPLECLLWSQMTLRRSNRQLFRLIFGSSQTCVQSCSHSGTRWSLRTRSKTKDGWRAELKKNILWTNGYCYSIRRLLKRYKDNSSMDWIKDKLDRFRAVWKMKLETDVSRSSVRQLVEERGLTQPPIRFES